ncbi:MAG: chromosomal replication initiator DnaA [Hyphomicrobiales bacterium]
MNPSARQLILELSHRTALAREDFLVAPSNAAAVALIDRWPDWPSHAALLVGPAGSGKSHLVEVWRQLSGARRVAAGAITAANVPDLLEPGSLAIEDAPGDRLDERGLFHLFNLARQKRASLLLTAMSHPAAWNIALPDLVSRLRAAPAVELGPPDDMLLRGVLVKLFADRQLAVDEPLVSFLLTRMPRSLDAARLLVAEIDRRALEERAEVTRTFVSRVLAGFTAPGLFGEDD